MESQNLNPFKNSELTTILVVSDMGKSKEFYVNALGAELVREYGGTSMVLKFLGNWLLLVTAGGPTEDKPKISMNPPSDPNNISHAFTIRVGNCTKSYDILKGMGVNFITAPFNRGAETRCFFQDPDGNLFEISEYNG
jgi:catechol 2,3-dioxygenase-like lactoylglutathione lyase family enzyme